MVKLYIGVKQLLLHSFLLLLIFFVAEPILFIPVLFAALLHFLQKRDYNLFLIGGVYSLCMSSELVYYCYSLLVIVLLLSSKTRFYTASYLKIKRVFLFFLAYLFFTFCLQLFYNYSTLSFPLFIVTFISPIAILFYVSSLPPDKVSLPFLISNILTIAIVQIFIAFFLQAIPVGISTILNRPTFGDRVQGTTGNATNLTVLIVTAILPFLLNIFNRAYTLFDKFKILGITITFILIIFLNDTKTHLYAITIVFLATSLLNRFFFNKKLITKLGFVLTSVLVLLLSVNIISTFVSKKVRYYDDYIYGRYNAKALYYEYSFSLKTRPFYQYVIGTGPGTNGTRASNALAYDVMYKKENTVTLPGFIPPASSKFTRQYLSGLFTEDYAEQSNFRSATLGNPFNSICAIFVEFGIFGTFLFFSFLFVCARETLNTNNRFLSKASLFLLFAGILIAFLSQTFESPMAMHMMYMMLGISMLKGQTNLKNNLKYNSGENKIYSK